MAPVSKRYQTKLSRRDYLGSQFHKIMEGKLNNGKLCFNHVSHQSVVLTIIGKAEDVRIRAQFHACSTSPVLRSEYSFIIRGFQYGDVGSAL
jgi:hypothetical protein